MAARAAWHMIWNIMHNIIIWIHMKTMDLSTETEMEMEKKKREKRFWQITVCNSASHSYILLFRMKAFVRKAIFLYVIKNVNKASVHLLKHRTQHLYSFDSLTFWSHRIRDATKAKRLRSCTIPSSFFIRQTKFTAYIELNGFFYLMGNNSCAWHRKVKRKTTE